MDFDNRPELIEIKGTPWIFAELMYDSTANVFAENLYAKAGLKKCYAHRDMLPLLARAEDRLRQENLMLKICDAYRPGSVQEIMWNHLPDERYVAHPAAGSNHTRGAAIDCVLCDMSGAELKFPTAVDGYRSDLAGSIRERMDQVLAHMEKCHPFYQDSGMVQEIKNRDLLRSIMLGAGFEADDTEWWHFNLPNAADYPLA